MTNGWNTYQELVLFRLDRLDGANVELINKVDQIDDRMVRIEADLKGVYLKSAIIAVAVSVAFSLGGRAVYELVAKVLF